MRYLMTGLAALALGAATSAAAAQDMVVEHDDLDLASAKGQKALDRRIDAAARAFCGVGVQQTGSRIKGNSAQCFREARTAAREQMATLIEKAQRGG